MFPLGSCLYAFQYLLCFALGQGKRTKDIEQKQVTKKVVRFISCDRAEVKRIVNYFTACYRFVTFPLTY